MDVFWILVVMAVVMVVAGLVARFGVGPHGPHYENPWDL